MFRAGYSEGYGFRHAPGSSPASGLAEINVRPPVQRVPDMTVLTQCCACRFRCAFILRIYRARAIPYYGFLFLPVLFVIRVRCWLDGALTVFCPVPKVPAQKFSSLVLPVHSAYVMRSQSRTRESCAGHWQPGAVSRHPGMLLRAS